MDLDTKKLKLINEMIANGSIEVAIRELLCFASVDWEAAIISLRRERVFVNRYGDSRTAGVINGCLEALLQKCPKKYKKRYEKYKKTIEPLNRTLKIIASDFKKADIWKSESGLCLATFLARFELTSVLIGTCPPKIVPFLIRV